MFTTRGKSGTEMSRSSSKDNVIKAAAYISIPQSLIWMALSITGLIAHSCLVPATSIDKDALSTILYHQYFREKECVAILDPTQMPKIEKLSTSEDVYIWMWLYLFVSFFWFISSLFLAMSKTRFKRSSKLIVIAWLVITSIVCIMDFILAIFFGLDYQHIHDFQVLNSILGGKPLAMQTAAGLMMAMAMRGFVLWFINACLIAYITTITVLSEKTKMPKQHMQGNTWLYDNISIGGGDFGESKPKGLPKTNPPTSGWASLQELMRRYKIHTPKRSKTPVQDNGQVNNGFQSDPPLQFVYPRVSNDRDFYENSSIF